MNGEGWNGIVDGRAIDTEDEPGLNGDGNNSVYIWVIVWLTEKSTEATGKTVPSLKWYTIGGMLFVVLRSQLH